MSKAESLPGMRPLPLDLVKEKERNRNLLPTRDAFKGKRGYWERPRPDGGYDWGYRFTTNEGGKITKEGGEVLEAMKPFAQADVARAANANGFPGAYAGRGKRMDARMDGSPARITNFQQDFCGNCDRLLVWCDCEADPCL